MIGFVVPQARKGWGEGLKSPIISTLHEIFHVWYLGMSLFLTATLGGPKGA